MAGYTLKEGECLLDGWLHIEDGTGLLDDWLHIE